MVPKWGRGDATFCVRKEVYKETAVPETDFVPEKEQCQRPPSSPAFLKYLQLKVNFMSSKKRVSEIGHFISFLLILRHNM